MDLAQKALTRNNASTNWGQRPFSLSLTRRQDLAQAEASLLQAQINYQVAVAAVDHATAGLLQPYHVQIAELSQ